MQTTLLCLLGAASSTPTLTVSPLVLAVSGDNVTLEWDGAASGYTIGVFRYPERLNSLGHIPLNSTKGSISIPLLNARTRVFFALCDGTCKTIADGLVRTVDVFFAMGHSEPTQGHLALVGDEQDTLILRFTTGVKLAVPQVRVATSLAALSLSPTVWDGITEDPYTIADMCFEPASDPDWFFGPGYQHEVRLDGLTPGTVYYLQFGSNETGNWSRSFSMTSPQEDEVETHIVYGDMGVAVQAYVSSSHNSYIAAASSVQWMSDATSEDTWMNEALPWTKPSLILHIGDISYARGYPDMWEHFMSAIEPLAMRVPYMVSIGNHEYDYVGHGQKWHPKWWSGSTDSGGECGVAYSSRFHMPEVDSQFQPEPSDKPNRRNLWYSFNKGMVHYLVFSTEHNFTEHSPQYRFITADLAKVNRTVTPWLVVTAHRPLYTTKVSIGMLQDAVHLRATLEPLLVKYRVDLALWGHQHQYERICAITQNFTCATGDQHGTVHVIVGNAGNPTFGAWDYPAPEYSRFRANASFGVTTITTNRTHLRLDYHGDYPAPLYDTVTLTTRN